MRILIDINHPAHVHLFRNAAKLWMERGDTVQFTATDKGVVKSLLAAYNLPHEIVWVRRPKSNINMARELIFRTLKYLGVIGKFKPDVTLSTGSMTAAWASFLLRKPHFAFDDTEDSIGQAMLYRPFVKNVCLPECFGREFGGKSVCYAGYHELAYLHPNRFLPNPMNIAPLSTGERYFVVRFIEWGATHDVGQRGLSEAGQAKLLALLQQHGRVVLSREKHPPMLLGQAGAPDQALDAQNMHDLLAFATMYIGEGVTAASEAAVLGTPSILINTRELGYILEQQDRYRLAYHFKDEAPALEKITKLLQQGDLQNVWELRQAFMLSQKTDVTAWMVDFIDKQV